MNHEFDQLLKELGTPEAQRKSDLRYRADREAKEACVNALKSLCKTHIQREDRDSLEAVVSWAWAHGLGVSLIGKLKD